MKKILIIFLFITLLLGVFIVFNKKQISNNKEIITYKLNNKSYKLYTARNLTEWETGLMYFRKLNGADGMIFIFPDKQIRSFWNKNTFMDLDIYWLDDKLILGKNFLPSIEKSKNPVIVTSPDKANIVIELQSGK